ncbi:SDR family oxidoreductase [Leucobacter celer]|uniref:SDR family oxidoreductase n=1 Tax=Leucobacter celer TaxID=668625 RepID=UPI0009499143|nr:SDR family oxidoreductase [Leucobacter celer]
MIGVTGASGALGRRVVRELTEAGRADLMLGTRSGTLTDAPAGAEVRTVDFTDEAGTRQAFTGVEHLLLISTGADTPERIKQHLVAIDAAVAAGVRRIVYTSFIDHQAASPFPFAAVHEVTERALRESGVPWVALRNGQYADRFIEFAAGVTESGALRLPIAPDMGSSFISRDDLARFAARVLRFPEIEGVLTPTGVALVTYAQATEALAKALGRPVVFEQCSPKEYYESLIAEGWPEWEAEAFTMFFDAIAEGRTSTITTDFADLLGVDPTPVAAFIAAGVGRE